MRHYFELLGISQNASEDQLAKAYHRQLAAWDPKRFAHNDRLRRRAERKTQELQVAFLRLEAARHPAPRKAQTTRKEPLPELPQSEDFEPAPAPPKRRSSPRRSSAAAETAKSFVTAAAYAGCMVALAAVCMMVVIDLASMIQKGGALAELQTRAAEPANVSVATPRPKPAPVKALQSYAPNVPSIAFSRQTPSKSSPAMVSPAAESSDIFEKRASRPALVDTAARCDVRGARRLLNGGADVNVPDGSGDTALSWAAKSNCLPVAKLLLEWGADPLHVSRNGFTPRRWASWYKNFEVVALLDKPRF